MLGSGKGHVCAVEGAERADEGDVLGFGILLLVYNAVRGPGPDVSGGVAKGAVSTSFDIKCRSGSRVVRLNGETVMVGVKVRGQDVFIVKLRENILSHGDDGEHKSLFRAIEIAASDKAVWSGSSGGVGEDGNDVVCADSGLKVLRVVIIKRRFRVFGGNHEAINFCKFDFESSGDSESKRGRRNIVWLEVENGRNNVSFTIKGDVFVRGVLLCMFGFNERVNLFDESRGGFEPGDLRSASLFGLEKFVRGGEGLVVNGGGVIICGVGRSGPGWECGRFD